MRISSSPWRIARITNIEVSFLEGENCSGNNQDLNQITIIKGLMPAWTKAERINDRPRNELGQSAMHFVNNVKIGTIIETCNRKKYTP